jgi:hypothetical protein
MIRLSLPLVALLVVPAFAGNDVWRWRDANGQLHYSNIEERIPAYAELVKTQIGHASVPAAAPVSKDRAIVTPAPSTEVRRESSPWSVPAGPGGWAILGGPLDCCPPYGLQHLLTTTGRSLADQVQEASLLDALNVRWRSLGCR